MRTSSSFALPWFVKPVLLLMTGLLLSQSVLTTAQQPTPQPVPNVLDMLTASGDAYLSSMSSAALLGTELMSTMEMIKQTPIEQLSEASIIDARTRALDMARDSAVALGAVDDLSQSIRTMSPTSPTALDVSAVAQGGLPAEMRQYMIDEIGLSAAQVDALQQQVVGSVAARQDIKGDGLPDATRQSLEQIGFSPDEIGQVASALGSRGLFDPSIQTRLDQFKSSQDDVASNRTRALILYVQLLGTQIGVRQSTGVAPRPLSETDTYALAQDELRLLIHTAQLEALWGNDPSLDKGEGHWWFIERYAHRAGERIEQLTLDTQNRGLIVDLLLVEQMETLALSARSGDPAYVKAELDRLAELLAIQLGQPAFLAQQRQEMRGKINGLAQVAAPGRREQVEWQVSPAVSSLVAANSVGRIQEEARLRAQLVSGDFDELDEANNQMDLLFAAGLPNLDEVTADVINTTITVLSDANTQAEIVSWIKAILTGDTDNPMFMAANVVMSLIPVIGVIPDIATLITSDNVLIKALSLMGIVGSLGDIIAIIPGAQAIGGASFLSDAAATVLKIAARRSADMLRALNALPLPKVFQVVIQLVSVSVPRIIKIGGDLMTKEGLVAALMRIFEATGQLWESFVSFVYHGGVKLLTDIGFDEGSVVVGGVLNRLGSSLPDETLRNLDGLADRFVANGVELSDDLADGMAKVADDLGPDAELFYAGAGCFAQSVAFKPRGLAAPVRSPLAAATLDCPDAAKATLLYKQFDNKWSKESVNGLGWAIHHNGETFVDQAIQRFRLSYSDETIEKTFRSLQEVTIPWTNKSFDGLIKTVDKYGDDSAKAIFDAYGEQKTTVYVFELLDEFMHVKASASGDPLAELVRSLAGYAKDKQGGNKVGAFFELRYGTEMIGVNNISVYQDYAPNTGNGALAKGVDFITNDGRYIDVKNYEDLKRDYNKIVNQFKKYVGLGFDADGNPIKARYGSRKYEYVFRSEEDKTMVKLLCDVARQKLTKEHLEEFTIRFMGWDKPIYIGSAIVQGKTKVITGCP